MMMFHPMYRSLCGRCRRWPWLVAVSILAAAVGVGRPAIAQNTYAARIALAQALNAGVSQLQNDPNATSMNFGQDLSGVMTISDPMTGTRTLNGTNGGADVVLVKGAQGFVLRVLLRDNSSRLVTIEPGSHPLPCDVEHLWLRRSWGKMFRDSVNTWLIGEGACRTTAAGGNPATSRYTQEYFMGTVDDINGPARADVKWGLNIGGIADWELDARTYNVPDGTIDAVALVNSSQLLDFSINHGGTDRFLYVARRVQGPSRDTVYAKLAYTSLEFTPPAGLRPINEDYVEAVTLEARTHGYANDCSAGIAGGVDPTGASIKFSYRVRLSAGGTQVYACEWRSATGDPAADNAALWSRYDQGASTWGFIDQWASFEVDPQGYLVMSVNNNNTNECLPHHAYRIMQVRSRRIPNQYCEASYPWGGQFVVDPQTGVMSYRSPAGIVGALPTVLPVPCLPFAARLSGQYFAHHVIGASAVELSDEIPVDRSVPLPNHVLDTWGTDNLSNNRFEIGEGKWRPKSSYAYRTEVRGGVLPNERIYDSAGVFLPSGNDVAGFRLFDWNNPAANAGTKWLRAGTVTLYSPRGFSLEERDILGIPSAARYAHHETVPSLVARNAEYASVGFESFEESVGGDIAVGIAHSGSASYLLPTQGASAALVTVRVTEQLKAKGLLVRFWAKRTYDGDAGVVPMTAAVTVADSAPTKIAQTGAWSLYELTYTPGANAALGSPLEIRLQRTGGDAVWIDDVRAQPYDAEMNCYVYDITTLRLITSFDDQHFGVFHQYDGEGKLVRTRRETERGVKTVAEAQYHVPDPFTRAFDPAGSGMPAPPSGGMLGATSSGRAKGKGGAGGKSASDPRSGVNLLDIRGGLGGVEATVLKGHEQTLKELLALFTPDTGRLTALQRTALERAGLADAGRLELAAEARAVDERAGQLERRASEETDAVVRRHLDDERHELLERRERIVRDRLGVNEPELRAMYDVLDQIRGASADTESKEGNR